jgi:hypothetical protein
MSTEPASAIEDDGDSPPWVSLGFVDERAFWKLINRVDRGALAEDEDEAVAPLIEALARLAPADIAAFEEHLALHLYALDGRRYADEAGESSSSDDAFLYARCFVVAQGEAHFRRVLDAPALMPKSSDQWCEALLSVASNAYERVTGEELAVETSVSYETGSNRAQWD